MGALDDAIREHLELKRKHGASEDELKRQETEALGPARREVERSPGEEAAAPEEAVAATEEAAAGPVPVAEPSFDRPTEPHPAPEPEEEPEPEPEEAVEEGEEEGEEEVEDVLEETPDFLEETPEHDRLWFEQRPPRDFDFDD